MFYNRWNSSVKCYLLFDYMYSSYSGASIVVVKRVSSTWKSLRELFGDLVGKQDVSFKDHGNVYCIMCYGIPVLLYCSQTWELTVADELKLCGHHTMRAGLISLGLKWCERSLWIKNELIRCIVAGALKILWKLQKQWMRR